MTVVWVILFLVACPILWALCGAAVHWHLVLGIFLCGTAFLGLICDDNKGNRLISFLLFMGLGCLCISGEPSLSDQMTTYAKTGMASAVALSGLAVLFKGSMLYKPLGLIVLVMGGLLLVTL